MVTVQTLSRTYAAAAALHLVQAIVVFSLVNSRSHSVFEVTRTVGVWSPEPLDATSRPAMIAGMWVTDRTHLAGYYDVCNAIGAFFLISALCQGFEAWLLHGSQTYDAAVYPPLAGELDQVACVRLGEYSVTASVMMQCIALETGVRDMYTLMLIFFCVWACMALGLVAELLGVHRFWEWPHGASWLLIAAPWYVVLDAFAQTQQGGGSQAPAFVVGVVISQLAMFAMFGCVQLATLMEWWERDTGELAYAIMSLLSKTLLAWLILSAVLV